MERGDRLLISGGVFWRLGFKLPYSGLERLGYVYQPHIMAPSMAPKTSLAKKGQGTFRSKIDESMRPDCRKRPILVGVLSKGRTLRPISGKEADKGMNHTSPVRPNKVDPIQIRKGCERVQRSVNKPVTSLGSAGGGGSVPFIKGSETLRRSDVLPQVLLVRP